MSNSISGTYNLDADAFMQMFITQMTHQDPMEPMDTTAMMSQLAELSTVQQLDAISANSATTLEELNSLNTNFASALQMEVFSAARDLIGQTITYSVDGEEVTGVVDSVTTQNGSLGVTAGEDFVTLDEIMKVAATAN